MTVQETSREECSVEAVGSLQVPREMHSLQQTPDSSLKDMGFS